jgi:hypothetical protein
VESLAVALMVLATVSLLGLFLAAARGHRLPARLFHRRTWTRAARWTSLLGGAATLGALLAGTGTLAGAFLTATVFLLAVEGAIWFDARTFGPR